MPKKWHPGEAGDGKQPALNLLRACVFRRKSHHQGHTVVCLLFPSSLEREEKQASERGCFSGDFQPHVQPK